MKYLKSFKIFESSSVDLLGTINDILLLISDLGIEYTVDNLDNVGLIHIKIDGMNGEINDCVNHLENHLKDLGHLCFASMIRSFSIYTRKYEYETHISIENNFNKEIENEFLLIIEDDLREIKNLKNNKFLCTTIDGSINYSGAYLDEEKGHLFYSPLRIEDYHRVFSFLNLKYSLKMPEIREITRYLVGKHLRLETLSPHPKKV